MKFDWKSIEEVEEREGVVILTRIQHLNQYLYARINKGYIETKEFEIRTARGLPYRAKFVDRGFVKNSPSVSYRGRPFDYCRDCETKNDCESCPFMKEVEERKRLRRERRGDDRFYKNGNPKIKYALCKSKKYRYAHGKKAEVCQKEKCRFYSDGKCAINLDKE